MAGLAIRHLRALLPWLLRHSGSLRQFDLTVSLASTIMRGAAAGEEAEALLLLDACLAASGSSGTLQQLAVMASYYVYSTPGLQVTFSVGSWAATLRSLQRLTLRGFTGCELRLLLSMEGLSQLRSLQLSAPDLHFGPAVALPPSLTCLVVDRFDDYDQGFRPAQKNLQVGVGVMRSAASNGGRMFGAAWDAARGAWVAYQGASKAESQPPAWDMIEGG